MSSLIYIMGKSASGKDTIYQKLKDIIDTNLYILYTTRPKREGEQQGREYFFITKNEFNEFQKKGKVIEARNYNVINSKGENDIWTYATIDDEQWKKIGKFLTIGTLESYNCIKKYLKEHPEKELKLLPIYITIDENERRKRAIKREEKQAKQNYEEMERRIKADNIDFSQEKLEEAGINEKNTFENYDLEECIKKIVDYIYAN